MLTPARVVLFCGLLILTLTVINASLTDVVTPEFQRAEVLAGLASVGLMLVATLWTRANPRSTEREDLTGEHGFILDRRLSPVLREELGWGSHMLLTATPAATVMVYWRGDVLLRRGLIRHDAFIPAAISNRVMESQKIISLVNTALFPGRTEFDPVLNNLPAVLVCPLSHEGIVVLGGWSKRCFSQSDERWLQGWVQRLRTSLESDSLLSNPDCPHFVI
ncbi:cofactor assembly of complex C subunit B [Synechococcus sp. M16CYN]|uniref:cofactor assembly of complex C subunit B n=1 Tax=Synechococcus sp. M16CYN TaxID=3103139 RepID=UPI0032560103